ncbi:MAG TPA: UvrD-helicase domain-containing protein [Solirubrobacterales bacterium]|nr:UvrD-helicase domain-containing protein [Solirubrobacterales bacterium]
MSKRAPTEEQRAAIEATAAEVLVEAGAGTGKTGVMVDRYCRLVCEQGVSPGAVLAFTFTDKAAAELRQRIRAEIERRAEAGSKRAKELVPTLGGAWVMTIHGFCNRLLSAHPVAVGIDPRFRVLNSPEAERAAVEAFDEALEAFLAGGDREREDTVAAFDIGGLRGIVLGVHAELRSRGEAEPRLPEAPEPDAEGALRHAAAVAAETVGELKPGSTNHELVERALALLERAEGSPSLDEMTSLRTASKAKPIAAYKEAIEAALSRVAEAGEGGLAYRHVAELLWLFSERFAIAKRRRAGIDFEDLQLLAARLLERTETGAAYRVRFSHLLVDEFQDTNRLQLSLIESLRGPGTQLMVVGDELQSIYGFRHADLDVFRERREAIEASPTGEAIPLSGNFRSRPEVIGAVNAIGERLLEDYTPLRVGAPPAGPGPAGEGPAVEILLTGREGWDEDGIELDPATDARTPTNQLAEARFLAARLRELADRGVERGAMVVLLRAFTRLDAHEDSLERAGLRPYVVGGRGYWSQQQVADVCALLATIANPLDDQALLGTLASPVCGVAPDTLWLLRAAAGRGRHIWPTVEQAAGLGEDERADAERLAQIPATELSLLRTFAETIVELRRRATSLSLAGLIDAAVTATGYDLAVLTRRAGESRFANVRKLMRLAAEFEAAEGRDLRGLLDFLAARADADADAQAATAVEGHDGVRIMTIHSAKGLEFDVVAIPHLSRGLLPAARGPMLSLGRELEAPRVGMQLRRLGARAVDLYAQRELSEDAQRRQAQEELRLFHVGATRARERLLLSGVVRPSPPSRDSHGKAVIERIVAGLEIDRECDSNVAVAAPEPRPGLEAAFEPSEIAVRVNLASVERAASLTELREEPDRARDDGEGPAPLVTQRPRRATRRALSYTAISAHGESPEQRLVDSDRALRAQDDDERTEGDSGAVRGRAVHALLEWSQANEWQVPSPELVRRIAMSAEVDAGSSLAEEALLAPFQAWLDSSFFAERIRDSARSRAEVPLLIEVADTVLRGSIDLLVEEEGKPPLIVDYKTDKVDEAETAELAARYEIQQIIYALAVAEARGSEEVELAYVFLERPGEPAVTLWGPDDLAAGRQRLKAEIARVRAS